LERRNGRVPTTERPWDFTGGGITHDRILHQRHLHVEHSDVDFAPLTSDGPIVQGRIDADRRVEACCHIADRHPDARRLPARLTGDAHDAAHGLHDHVVSRPFGMRTRMPETGAGGVDESWILGVQGIPPIAEFFHRARPEVLHYYIRLREQLLEDSTVLILFEVESDAFFAAIYRYEVGGL